MELVPSLPPEAPPEAQTDEAQHDYAEYADLLASLDPSYVSFIRSVLTAEGIDHYVLGEHASHVLALSVQQIVRVRDDQIERARQILDDIENSHSSEVD